MKKAKIISAVCALALVITLVWAYIAMPDTVILYKDRKWQTNNVSKIVLSDNSVETLHGAIVPRKTGDYQASATIFGIPYKSVTVKVVEDDEVIVGGQAVGIRLYSDGLVVVATGRINKNGKSPAEKAGIKPGDIITMINSTKVGTPEEFSEKVAKSQGEIELEIKSNEKTRKVKITPETSEYDGIKKIGLWVRDSTAGIGTLTYIDPESKTFGALGHAVSDVDTGVKFDVLKGSIEECSVGGIEKGTKGTPGELKGVFYPNARVLGYIAKNEAEGIFGIANDVLTTNTVKLGHKNDIKKGKAYIRVSLDGKTVKDYEIKITKVSPKSKNPAKGILIEVVDSELISKTGGIVQGMSGSPILQDGKLIGAVTHVLVNDPTKGYGIFIENMIEASGN
ncbi:MAG: SpoIVB peptidase [Clostridia bacterium]|nr:SpoIVB peptidase [Clostridia bacterium]